MVEAIIIVGWRSDSGAYLVDSYPQGTEIDAQDLLNLFSLHRMSANRNFDKAVANFNYLQIQGAVVASWYSGFRTTKYMARPDFCVSLVLKEGENGNIWEEQLQIICYNLLKKLEDADYADYIAAVYDAINSNHGIEPLPGFDQVKNVEQVTSPVEPTPMVPDAEPQKRSQDDFSDLLALAETQATESNPFDSAFSSEPASAYDPFSKDSSSSTSKEVDPFGITADSNKDAFAGDPFADKNPLPVPASVKKEMAGMESAQIIAELKKLDKLIPPNPKTDDKDQLFSFLEKKVGFLEQKIGVLSKLIRSLQNKELELNEKNALIGKLLTLLN